MKPKQLQVLKEIAKSYNGKTINEISKNTGLSWNTIKKYIEEFLEKDFIKLNKNSKKAIERQMPTKLYYVLSPSLEKQIKEKRRSI